MRVVNGGSDLARLQALQKQALTTRDKLDLAAKEMTTGLRNDRVAASGGNLARLTSLERALARNGAFAQTLSLAELRLDTIQSTLGRLGSAAGTLAVDLAESVGKGEVDTAMLHARTARQDFADTVNLLNGQVSGQSLFAGTATDGPALASADAILGDLDAAAGSAATAADAIAAIESYFSRTPPGGFYTNGYLGTQKNLTPVEIGDGDRLDSGLRADDDALVAVLRSQAMAAVVAGGAFADSGPDRLALLREAGTQMLAAKEDVLELSARVGSLQVRVENGLAHRTAERDTLESARTGLLAADPLETASAYQALEVQLESIYTVTARLASLRFSNFMR